MLKAPITKTGDIKYIEVIKLAVLISFLIAFYSQVTSHQNTLQYASLKIIGVMIALTFINLVILSITGYIEATEYIKLCAIRLVFNTPIKINLKELSHAVINAVLSIIPIQSRVLVMRC